MLLEALNMGLKERLLNSLVTGPPSYWDGDGDDEELSLEEESSLPGEPSPSAIPPLHRLESLATAAASAFNGLTYSSNEKDTHYWSLPLLIESANESVAASVSALLPSLFNQTLPSYSRLSPSSVDFVLASNITAVLQDEVFEKMGPIRDPLSTVIPMTLVYTLIFITGVIGNVCTCIVIARNKYMHTTVNYYLFSLAMSDLLLLILGLPQELWMLWRRYPYIFGESFCIIRALTSETSTNASVLTITAFTVERYLAICHPLKAHTMAKLPRAIKAILIIWAIAAICSLPTAAQLGIIYQISQTTRTELQDTAQCAVKHQLPHAFEISTVCFFVLPMSVMTVLYVLIALRLRESTSLGSKQEESPEGCVNHNQDHGQSRCGSTSGAHQRHQAASRRAVVKMLVLIVISFFICWSPFHVQRVMATHIYEQTEAIMMTYTIITYISGVTYYLTATINPILYQLMSLKFRLAFKDTFGMWFPGLKPVKMPDFTYSTAAPAATTGGEMLPYTSIKLHGGSFRGAANGASIRAAASFHQLSSLNSQTILRDSEKNPTLNNSASAALLTVNSTDKGLTSSSCSDLCVEGSDLLQPISASTALTNNNVINNINNINTINANISQHLTQPSLPLTAV